MPAVKSLVIVESPAKARTIASYLGSGYVVESSIGHIRDLPKGARDVPATHKKQPWARLGVDVDHGFRPFYVLDPSKRQRISKLKALLQAADQLYLATDEDREGESIAWHLLEVLKPAVPVKRMVFHEITERAIQHAIKHPRDVDRRLVDAQEARRILDRLYGYEVSPVLWKKVMPRLSAGRVQSVATRILVERERERMRHRQAEYWGVEGAFATDDTAAGRFSAALVTVDGSVVATGKDFGEDGKLRRAGVRVLDVAQAERWAQMLGEAAFCVRSVERKPKRRFPSPPFMTSTLQQEAGRKLRFSSARTMKAAQSLYESGYITYMRTDSTTLSASAVRSAREQIRQLYGAEYLPDRPRVYRKKVKNAQEAHEAIRPAGEVFRLPEQVAREVGRHEARLYELIWKRTVASQMSDALGESVTLCVQAHTAEGREAQFAASGYTITFPGFLRAYVEGTDDPAAELEHQERHLPAVAEGQPLTALGFTPQGHQTQPPARFTEASLVRRMEELGVGRPSTYAAIISTILDRGYVWRKGAALVPSFKAIVVVALLEQYFTALVDYAFTARMEDELDGIARGTQRLVPWLTRFYFGQEQGSAGGGEGGPNGTQLVMGLRSLVADRLSKIDARAISSLSIGRGPNDQEVVVRVGRYGAYLQRGEDTATLREDLPPDELTLELALELLDKPNGQRKLGTDLSTGLPVYVRAGRFGAYVQLGEAGKGRQKPKTCSLLRDMSPESITLEGALRLLGLPRQVGIDPADNTPITAQLGRYGPYVAKGSESRSLPSEEALFTITLPEALALFAQPRRRRGRTASSPLMEFGEDPVTGRRISLREGPFGPYVTDGEVNAALRKGDVPQQLTAERAQELLRLRREQGPARRKRSSKGRSARRKVTKQPVKPTARKVKTPKQATSRTSAARKAGGRQAAAKQPRASAAGGNKAAAKRARAGAAGGKSSAARSRAAGKSAAASAGSDHKPPESASTAERRSSRQPPATTSAG
jgi:DNA topoisomerase-1